MLSTIKFIIDCETTIVSYQEWSLIVLWPVPNLNRILKVFPDSWYIEKNRYTKLNFYYAFSGSQTLGFQIIYLICQYSTTCHCPEGYKRACLTLAPFALTISKTFRNREMSEKRMQCRGELNMRLYQCLSEKKKSQRKKKMTKIFRNSLLTIDKNKPFQKAYLLFTSLPSGKIKSLNSGFYKSWYILSL